MVMENYREVTVHEAHKLLKSGEGIMIDVREPDEYLELSIPGTPLHPMSMFDMKKLPDWEGKTLIVQCRSGGRSAKITEFLLMHGEENVVNLAGGILDWQEQGLPTQSGIEPYSCSI